MKIKGFPFLLVTYLLLSAAFVSCDKDNEDDLIPTDPVAERGLYILNRGNYHLNNASIGYLDLDTDSLAANIYETANGSRLGESAEQMLIYGSKIYVAITFSNRIAVLDLKGKLIKSIEPKDESGSPMSPRCLTAANGSVFVSYYDGHAVAKLDTITFETITGKTGRYPEQLAIANNKLYVTNSGGGDYPNYGNTVAIHDINTLQKTGEIEVTKNPCSILSDLAGDLYLISLGDYGVTVDNTLQRIDGKTHQVTILGKASRMTLANHMLYAIYAPYGKPEITYKKYDTRTEKFTDENFIKDGTTIVSPNSINVHPTTGEIFIGNYDYASTSSIYIFTSGGTLSRLPIDTGGYDIQSVSFYTNKQP